VAKGADDFGFGDALIAGAVLGVISAVVDTAMRPRPAPVVFVHQRVLINQQMVWFVAPKHSSFASRRTRSPSAERRRRLRQLRMLDQPKQ
jgi:hypothetical protein